MRSSHTHFWALETLEPRCNLSGAGGLAVPPVLVELAFQHAIHLVQLPDVVKLTTLNSHNASATPRTSSTTSSDTSTTPPPDTTALPAPTNLTAIANVDSITLQWVDNSTTEDGFHLYRSDNGGAFQLVGWTWSNGNWYTDPNLTPGSTYTYYVTAFQSTTESAPTNLATARISTVAPPTGFATALVTDLAVTLQWQDPNTSETGYRVYRSTDGVAYALQASLAANTTLYQDTDLPAGTKYWYKVSAWNAQDEAVTTALSTTTKTTVTPPTTFTSQPVTITLQNRGTFNELQITGTPGNDKIHLSQSGGMLTIEANGMGTTYGSDFGDILIWGAAGDDLVTVDNSVQNATIVYGGDGNNVIKNLTQGKATIVSIGSGTNALTGNGVDTAYWVNPWDSAYATLPELALGGLNEVANFYQPWTTDTSSPDYIPRDLNGQNFLEPTDSTATIRLPGSFFGTGPVMEDINQTSLGDCFFLSVLATVAHARPDLLANMGVDLGDGTYAVRYIKNGVPTFVRVDGDLGTGPWNGLQNQMPGPSGNLWGCMFEKAYAYFSGGNTYAALGWGFITQSYADIGMSTGGMWANNTDSDLLALVTAKAANNIPMTVGTYSTIVNGAPLIHSHSYTVINAWRDNNGVVQFLLRNVWGIDGAGYDGNDDGLVTVNYTDFKANCIVLYYTI